MDRLARLLAIAGGLAAVAAPGRTAENPPPCPLLTEVMTDPGSQFVELWNPANEPIALDGHFLSNSPLYFGMTTQDDRVDSHSGLGAVFNAGFPDDVQLGARKRIVIALNGSDGYRARFGTDPDFELYEDGAAPDAIPDLNEAFPGSIGEAPGLLAGGDTVMLYRWDFASDRICDCDYVHWGLPLRVDKTGHAVDGIDEDFLGDPYADETPPWEQLDLTVSAGSHGAGKSFHRRETEPLEGDETATGANNGCPIGTGTDSHDETSEDLATTWGIACSPTPGAGPAALTGCGQVPDGPLAVIDAGAPAPKIELFGLPADLFRPKLVFRAVTAPSAKGAGTLVAQKLSRRTLASGLVTPRNKRWRQVLAMLGEHGIVDVTVEDRKGQAAHMIRLELGERATPVTVEPVEDLLADSPPPRFRFQVGPREKSVLEFAADANFRTIVRTVRLRRGEATYAPRQRSWGRLRAKLDQAGAHGFVHFRFVSTDLAGRPAAVFETREYARQQ